VIHAAIVVAALAKPQPISWATVRAAIAEEICVVRYPGEEYGPSIGNRAACGAAPAATQVEMAVETALASAMPLLVSVPPAYTAEPEGLTAVYAEADEVKRDRMARDAYLSDRASDGQAAVFVPHLQRPQRSFPDRESGSWATTSSRRSLPTTRARSTSAPTSLRCSPPIPRSKPTPVPRSKHTVPTWA
jgi:hypothetical protein